MIAWTVVALLATTGPAESPPGAPAAEQAIVVVDLNHATAEELTRLPGIGPRRAEAIIARRSKRPFTRVTQLLEVRGIGKRTLERLKPHLRIVPVVPLAAPRKGRVEATLEAPVEGPSPGGGRFAESRVGT